MQIGDKLKSGIAMTAEPSTMTIGRLTGIFFSTMRFSGCAFEISSMGIRVDPKSLDEQLTKANADNRRKYPFHKALLAGELPLTIGGGIGQSRLSMPLQGKAHIGEVQVSVWDDETLDICRKKQYRDFVI